MNKMFHISVFIFAMVLFNPLGSSITWDYDNYSNPVLIEKENYKGVIFPKEYDLGEKDTLKRWTPTEEDIEKAEKILKKFMKKESKKKVHVNQNATNDCPIIHDNINYYFRQYAGIIDEKGMNVIYINCIWNEYLKSPPILGLWDKEFIRISEGCSYFWNIKVNISKDICFDYNINELRKD